MAAELVNYATWIMLCPLIGAIMAGFWGKQLGEKLTHLSTIILMAISTGLSWWLFAQYAFNDAPTVDQTLYSWAQIGDIHFQVGILLDRLTTVMLLVVTTISLAVHVYTIGYMKGDPGYCRFFSYISLFTFAMLTLVMANNFMQLFFGWEGVGLVSYLLIGFWFKRPSAIRANLKAFLMNRVGDFGFLLGIAMVFTYFGSLDYSVVFGSIEQVAAYHGEIELWPGAHWSLFTVIAILLFIGAMGKSAQIPLHAWLPDSMEGPTPISALIHAATMVTAGIFMVARLSPIFEMSETALAFVLFIGATTAFFMGLLGVFQNDIKRVIAYSTLSQLGYMVVALGVSAYAAGIFHLMTHAFFKALLFLAAGSVIIGMHHQQDIRKMGQLWNKMPFTWATSLIGTLALVGMPFTSGFYSKDMIIEAVAASELPGAGWALFAVTAGVFITALYSFRLYFMVFHGKDNVADKSHLHESPYVVTVPLLLLAIPSIGVAWPFVQGMLFGGYFEGVISVEPAHDVLAELAQHFHGVVSFALHGFTGAPFILLLAGALTAFVLYQWRPSYGEALAQRCSKLGVITTCFKHHYGFDALYLNLIAPVGVRMGQLFSKVGDGWIIDGGMVHGTARLCMRTAQLARGTQTGYLYHYAFVMIIGLLALIGWLLLGL